MLLVDSSFFKLFISKHGLLPFINKVASQIERDFLRWHEFDKSPRHAAHVSQGVMELMPCSDGKHFSFKYVNGHPGNTKLGKLNIVGFGVLVEAHTGLPIMMSEMTWMTAIRTAATSALVAKYGASKNTKSIGIIGCGAQSEFQILALHSILGVENILFYDTDSKAMEKFSKNLGKFNLKPCKSSSEVSENSDVLVTNIGFKGRQSLLQVSDLQPGQLIIAIGGDCPGKTELSAEILRSVNQIWVEYLPQTMVEGEIQQWPDANPIELHDIIKTNFVRKKSEIILFDGVGFAIEDFSILKVLYQELIANDSVPVKLIAPNVADPKDLFGALYE